MIFPQARALYRKGQVHSWQQAHTGGAWPALLPHQSAHLAALQRREGPIYFAGDHTSLHMGWAQGAFERAHCAVAELIADRLTAERRVAS